MSAAARMSAGEAPFSRATLAVYDPLVLGLICRWVWHCPVERIVSSYRARLSGNHLEVGVGTGYFLERSGFPVRRPRLGLLDLNPNCLAEARARLARYEPEVYVANILEPIELAAPRFSSIALNYVLHCLPGAMKDKAAVFGRLGRLLVPGGVLFGATVVSAGAPATAAARALMRACNTAGIFSNSRDDLDALEAGLRRYLHDVHIETCGCVALFHASAR